LSPLPPTQFSFTKLLVDDLEETARFYKSVCGMVETGRVEAEIGGRKISEILFAPAYQGAATFVLLKFLDAPKPTNDEVILGFVTDDVEAFVERAKAAGGALAKAPYDNLEHGVKVGFVTDVEGHLIEVVQLL
jgi:catechol 2,3-dioxygenase-like lactoylglutathione lyase family enzyme